MTTTSRVGLELTIALPSREDAVHLDVAGDVTVAEVTEFLADHYQVERTGFRVWDGRALLSPAGRTSGSTLRRTLLAFP